MGILDGEKRYELVAKIDSLIKEYQFMIYDQVLINTKDRVVEKYPMNSFYKKIVRELMEIRDCLGNE